MKTMFLLSHTPIPRFIKRIEVASNNTNTMLIYWDRKIKNDIKFSLPDSVDCESIKLRAPQGKPFLRSFLLLFFGLKSIIRMLKFRPNNIHIGNFDMLLIAYLYKQLINKQVKIIYEVGDLPEITFKSNYISKIYKNVEKIMLKKVKHIILTSPYFWDKYYIKITDESKYNFIPNVPPKSILNNSILAKRNNKHLTIGFIGSVRYKKQLKMLIDLLKNTKVNFLIAGGGYCLEEIKNYSRKYSNVYFTGPYQYKEIGDLYNSIDIVYSVYDTSKNNVKIALPNRLYESIVFEKPLIVSNNTELAKFVKEKGVGFTVSDTDPNDLYSLIEYLLKTPQALDEKVERCIEIKDQYFYEVYYSTIKSFYS